MVCFVCVCARARVEVDIARFNKPVKRLTAIIYGEPFLSIFFFHHLKETGRKATEPSAFCPTNARLQWEWAFPSARNCFSCTRYSVVCSSLSLENPSAQSQNGRQMDRPVVGCWHLYVWRKMAYFPLCFRSVPFQPLLFLIVKLLLEISEPHVLWLYLYTYLHC